MKSLNGKQIDLLRNKMQIIAGDISLLKIVKGKKREKIIIRMEGASDRILALLKEI